MLDCFPAYQIEMSHLALAKPANIAWQTLLFVSESLAMDQKVPLI